MGASLLAVAKSIYYFIPFISFQVEITINYYVLMKKIVSFSMLFIIKGCRNMEHRVAFSRS